MHILRIYKHMCVRLASNIYVAYVCDCACVSLHSVPACMYWLVRSVVCLFGQMMCVFWTFLKAKETEKCASNYIQLCEHRRNENLAEIVKHTRAAAAASFYSNFFFFIYIAFFIVILVIFGCFISKHNLCRMEKEQQRQQQQQPNSERNTIKILLA